MRLIDADIFYDNIVEGTDLGAEDNVDEALKRYLDLEPTVEAIPKADYENRLKADLKAILVELQLEIHELENPYPHDYDNLLPLAQHNAFYDAKSSIEDLVDEKINALKGGSR